MPFLLHYKPFTLYLLCAEGSIFKCIYLMEELSATETTERITQ